MAYTARGHKQECQNFILTGESKTFALLKSLIHAIAQYISHCTPALMIVAQYAGKNLMLQQLGHHPYIKSPLDSLWALVGGVSIRTKILGIVLALTIVLGLGVTWQVRQVMHLTLLNELERLGQALVSDLAARSAMPILRDDPATLQQLLEQTVANHEDARYAFIVNADGNVLANTFDEAVPPELLHLSTVTDDAQGHHLHYENYTGQVHDFAAPITHGEGAIVRIGLTEVRLHNSITNITNQMLFTTLLVALVGVMAATLLTWLLTRPILILVATTQKLRDGDLTVRAPHWADDEIGALADAFNAMVTELEISQQSIMEKEAARTRLLAVLLNAQEEERKRLARELHDGVGQTLTSLMVNLKLMQQMTELPPIQAKTTELRQVTSETLDEVRLLSRQLRPSALDDLGLAAALERYIVEFTSHYPDLNIDFHYDLRQRFGTILETNLYRIIQEAMTNAARHSRAKSLSILLTQRGQAIQAIIEDDGQGFDPIARRREGGSVGLHSMIERTDLLNGHLEIESSPDGTTIYVEIPYNNEVAP